MVWALVQVNCAPHGTDRYSMPHAFMVLAWFATEAEARAAWPADLVHHPDESLEGQNVYQMLWNTAQPLNLDRSIDNSNKVSNMGAWLPESARMAADRAGGAELEVVSRAASAPLQPANLGRANVRARNGAGRAAFTSSSANRRAPTQRAPQPTARQLLAAALAAGPEGKTLPPGISTYRPPAPSRSGEG